MLTDSHYITRLSSMLQPCGSSKHHFHHLTMTARVPAYLCVQPNKVMIKENCIHPNTHTCSIHKSTFMSVFEYLKPLIKLFLSLSLNMTGYAVSWRSAHIPIPALLTITVCQIKLCVPNELWGINYGNVWLCDVVWCQDVTEIKVWLLTRRFGGSVFCGREELLLVQDFDLWLSRPFTCTRTRDAHFK